MAFRTFDDILDECVRALQEGDSVDSCLARYPRQADRLRPLLDLAEKVNKSHACRAATDGPDDLLEPRAPARN